MDASGELYSPGRREPAVSLLSSGESDGSSAAMHGVGHNSIYESVHVLVRVRPLSQLELTENQESVVDIVDKQSLTVTSSDGKKVFKCTYDSVLGMSSTQLDVYNVVRSCTESVLDGFNSTIFAYGQTGSGKTYSMYGPPSHQSHPSIISSSGTAIRRDSASVGLIPRAISELFDIATRRSITDFQIHCSFVQIYNENLYDMLRDASMSNPLSIREDRKEIYVQGLSEYNVKSVADAMQLLKIAEDNRAIRETHMNLFSSRSHSIFQITIEHKKIADDGLGEVSYKAKFNLVDLAGSEKWNTKLYLREEHINEMTNINLSLHTLGKCISALAQISLRKNRDESRSRKERDIESRLSSMTLTRQPEGHTGSLSENSVSTTGGASVSTSSLGTKGGRTGSMHVPYRESKLTRLLQDCLGGNAKTVLIATISPARMNSEESISTLKFADRAKQVMVQAMVNESRPVDYELVKKLQQEISLLKGLIKRLVQSQSKETIRSSHIPSTISSDLIHQVLGDGQLLSNGQHALGLLPDDAATALTADTNSVDQLPSSKAAVESDTTGSTLEYVISLENTLKRARLDSHQLVERNETLMREIECLKLQNMQLLQVSKNISRANIAHGEESINVRSTRDGGSRVLRSKVGASDDRDPIDESATDERNVLDKAMRRQVIQSLHALLAENQSLHQIADGIQQTIKKFFKFQIEEEQMREQVDASFRALTALKSSNANESAHETIIMLESTASVDATPVHRNLHADLYPHPTKRDAILTKHQNQTLSYSSHDLEPIVAVSGRLPPMDDPMSRIPSSYSPPSHLSAQRDSGRNKSLPSLQGSLSNPLAAQNSDGSDPSVQPGSSRSKDVLSSYHIRTGGSSLRPVPSMGSSVNSDALRSSGGWMNSTLDETEKAEEELKRELKKAKKKMKKQQQLEEWQRVKDEKLKAELEAEDHDRRALQEAELLKEKKRQEYVQKQKAKLANYQSKVKSEAEKIQDLRNLGIDPSSLF